MTIAAAPATVQRWIRAGAPAHRRATRRRAARLLLGHGGRERLPLGAAVLHRPQLRAAGTVGAVVSVIARVNSGSFALNFDVAPGYTLFLGALRPVIGAVFGLLTFFMLKSDFVKVFDLPPDKPELLYFLWVIAFGSGFSERWAQDALTGGLGGQTAGEAHAHMSPVGSADAPAMVTAGTVAPTNLNEFAAD